MLCYLLASDIDTLCRQVEYPPSRSPSLSEQRIGFHEGFADRLPACWTVIPYIDAHVHELARLAENAVDMAADAARGNAVQYAHALCGSITGRHVVHGQERFSDDRRGGMDDSVAVVPKLLGFGAAFAENLNADGFVGFRRQFVVVAHEQDFATIQPLGTTQVFSQHQIAQNVHRVRWANGGPARTA